MTYNERIAAAGIETIRTGKTDERGRKIVMLSYRGEKVRRPQDPEASIELIRDKWGIEI